MAKIGANNFRYSKAIVDEDGSISYSGAKKPGKMISFQLTLTKSEAELYADDGLAESDSTVTGGDITLGLDRSENEMAADLFGHEVTEDGEVISNVNDVAPYVGVGRVSRCVVDGRHKFRATILRKTKFAEPDEEDTTRGQNTEFNTYTIPGKMQIPDDGEWRKQKYFDDLTSAISYIEDYFAPAVSV